MNTDREFWGGGWSWLKDNGFYTGVTSDYWDGEIPCEMFSICSIGYVTNWGRNNAISLWRLEKKYGETK